MFLGVTFSKQIVVVIDGKILTADRSAVPNYEKASVNVVFGSQDDSERYNSLLGPVGVYPPLGGEELRALAQSGPRSLPKTNAPAIAYALVFEQPDCAHLSFAQLLVDHCKVSSLLPLFDQLDATFPNGKELPGLVLRVVSILSAVLALKVAAQRDFVESNSPRMVGHLLSHFDDRHLTVSLSHEFVTLFDMVSYELLKRDLFEYVLVNYDVWIRTHADVQRQIARH
jgi:hypothetical protein